MSGARIAIATQIDLADGSRIWCPPTGKLYWVNGPKCPSHSAGPSLTDAELEEFVYPRFKRKEEHGQETTPAV